MNKYFGYSILNIGKYWLVTKVNIIRYYFKHVFPNKNVLKKTREKQDEKRGRKAFVFGNGPSLNILDPYKINNYKQMGFDIFCVHSYLISDFADTVKPTHYVITDPDWIWPERAKKGETFASEIVKNNHMLSLLDIPVFLPVHYMGDGKFKNEKVYFNDCEDFFSKYQCDITKSRPFSSVTGLKALWISDFLGYDEIYVCGIDATDFKTFIIDKENFLIGNFDHFYNDKRDKKINYYNDHDTASFLYVNHIVFSDLKKLSSSRIVNLDPNSYVDAFNKEHGLDVYRD